MTMTFYLAVGFGALLVLSVGGYTGLQLLRLHYQQQRESEIYE